MNDKENSWGGVRPVRFSEEIFAILERIINDKKIKIETIKEILIECRENREKRRLRALRIRTSTKDSSRKKEEFLTKAEQFVRVLRRVELIKQEGQYYKPLDTCTEIVAKLKEGKKLEAKTLFLSAILNSKFKSYFLFLKRLTKLPIIIPAKFSKRDKLLSDYLKEKEIYLDSWSFFILRDFFYDFGLLNYKIDAKQEKIFAVCTLDANNKNYSQKIQTPDGILYYWKKISLQKFIEDLSKQYLSLTDKKWDRYVDLITLRESFSESKKISEYHFNCLIEKTFNKNTSIKIIPSVGTIRHKHKKGYLTKVMNMPTDNKKLPYTLIRIVPRRK